MQAFAIFFGLAPGHGQFVIINTERQRHKTDLLKGGKTWRQEDTNGDGQIGTQTDWQKDWKTEKHTHQKTKRIKDIDKSIRPKIIIIKRHIPYKTKRP